MKKTKNTNRLQERIDNTLSIMEYSDYIRKEQTEDR
jgi:lipoteichoic acid synthase